MNLLAKKAYDPNIEVTLQQIRENIQELEKQENGINYIVTLANYLMQNADGDPKRVIITLKEFLLADTGEKIMTIADRLKLEGKLEGLLSKLLRRQPIPRLVGRFRFRPLANMSLRLGFEFL